METMTVGFLLRHRMSLMSTSFLTQFGTLAHVIHTPYVEMPSNGTALGGENVATSGNHQFQCDHL
eukprot:4674616-Karenia_brevis.AAC.1